jgi:hypothetical protein
LLTGGRISGYAEVADEMTPKEYVADVVAGKRRDPALTFQLKNGLVVLDVVPDYLQDTESRGFAPNYVQDTNRAVSPHCWNG